ncbi:hypothetical protein FOA52_000335 [Chlamydomonas sp. UWO 241]|nr:hypothetical protein FOA52_000335 [Chlamydomonas sp. UWO 241]
MKVDVEGYEADVFGGAARLLSRGLPSIVMEYSPHIHEKTMNTERVAAYVEILPGLIRKHGYKLGMLKDGDAHAPTPPSGPLPPLYQIKMENLRYDLVDVASGCWKDVPRDQLKKFAPWSYWFSWKCLQWRPVMAHPKSLRSSFFHNVNLWAIREDMYPPPPSDEAGGHSDGAGGHSDGAGGHSDGGKGVSAAQGGATPLQPKWAGGVGTFALEEDARMHWFPSTQTQDGLAHQTCAFIPPKDQVVNKCRCANATECGEEQAFVEALLRDGRMPSHYELTPDGLVLPPGTAPGQKHEGHADARGVPVAAGGVWVGMERGEGGGRGGRRGAVERLFGSRAKPEYAPDMVAAEIRYKAALHAGQSGTLGALRVMLNHPCAASTAVLVRPNAHGLTALMVAARAGHIEAMHLLLEHPCADPATMMMCTASVGFNPLMWAALYGQTGAMRLLLDHPYANPAAMMMQTNNLGWTAFMLAASNNQVEVMRLLLNHPSADPAAMITHRSSTDECALTAAALCAADHWRPDSWRPLLLLLHRVAMEPQPCIDQRTCMTKVLEMLCRGQLSKALFVSDQPDDVRDECIYLLLERGARCTACAGTPVVSRIICELAQMARVPQHVNAAVVQLAFARQQQEQGQGQRCAERPGGGREAPQGFFCCFK